MPLYTTNTVTFSQTSKQQQFLELWIHGTTTTMEGKLWAALMLGCFTAAAAYCTTPAFYTAAAQHNSGAAPQGAEAQQGEEMPDLQKPKPKSRRAPAKKRPKLTIEDLEVCSACPQQQAACSIACRTASSLICSALVYALTNACTQLRHDVLCLCTADCLDKPACYTKQLPLQNLQLLVCRVSFTPYPFLAAAEAQWPAGRV